MLLVSPLPPAVAEVRRIEENTSPRSPEARQLSEWSQLIYEDMAERQVRYRQALQDVQEDAIENYQAPDPRYIRSFEARLVKVGRSEPSVWTEADFD